MQAMAPQKISSNQALKHMFGKLSAKNMIYYGLFWSAYLLAWASHIALVVVMALIPCLWLYSNAITDSSQWWQYLVCSPAAIMICAHAVLNRPNVTFQKNGTQA